MDSLSNLIELDLSNNPQLFNKGTRHGNRGMDDLCGTVNQSLKRLSLRNCQLIPNDLSQMVSTFCWLEALDLSENSALISDILLLSQLEHLTELALENMIKYDTNEAFEFDRRLSDEDLDWETEGEGLVNLLFELLSGESEGFHNHRSVTGGIKKHRRKPLERLNLSGNIMNKKTLQILSRFNSLKVLILVGCQITGEGVTEFLKEIDVGEPGSSSLEQLYLASNTINDIGILALVQAISYQHLPLLKTLNLESNVISVEGFRIFVEEGLVNSKSLEFVQVSDDGAITSNQQRIWNELEENMEHNLLLNQAGRFKLFDDYTTMDDEEREEISINYNHCYNERNIDSAKKKKTPTKLWPLILENADSIYGADAIFYFIHKLPNLILSPLDFKSQSPNLSPPTPLLKSAKEATSTSSPKGVDNISVFLS